MSFYAVFIKESVYDATSDLKWFSFTSVPWEHPITGEMHQGLKVSPASGRILSGKITIPTEVNGQPVITIGGFMGQNVSHVFWLGTPHLLAFAENAFTSVMSLKYCEFPSTVIHIGQSAFNGCENLAFFDLAETCPNLQYIDSNCFNGCFYSATGDLTLNIPASVQYIGFMSFSYQRKIGSGGNVYGQVNLGSPTAPSQLTNIGDGENFGLNSGRSMGNFTAYGISNENLKNKITTYWLGNFSGTKSWN